MLKSQKMEKASKQSKLTHGYQLCLRVGYTLAGIPPETQKKGGGFITAKPQVQIDDIFGQSYKWVQGDKSLLQGPCKVQLEGF